MRKSEKLKAKIERMRKHQPKVIETLSQWDEVEKLDDVEQELEKALIEEAR